MICTWQEPVEQGGVWVDGERVAVLHVADHVCDVDHAEHGADYRCNDVCDQGLDVSHFVHTKACGQRAPCG